MLLDDEWVRVPNKVIQYRSLDGDTGETRGGHWCGVYELETAGSGSGGRVSGTSSGLPFIPVFYSLCGPAAGTLLKVRFKVTEPPWPTEGCAMPKRPLSAPTRSVPPQTPEQLLELTQEHIRPLIGLIDQLNEAGAEDELRVIGKQLTRLCFRVQPLPSDK